MKKKLALEELQIQSFVTGSKEMGGLVAYAVNTVQQLTAGDNCHSPLCMSNPECSFRPCEV